MEVRQLKTYNIILINYDFLRELFQKSECHRWISSHKPNNSFEVMSHQEQEFEFPDPKARPNWFENQIKPFTRLSR